MFFFPPYLEGGLFTVITVIITIPDDCKDHLKHKAYVHLWASGPLVQGMNICRRFPKNSGSLTPLLASGVWDRILQKIA